MQQHLSNLRRIAETTDEAVGDLSEVLRPLGSFEHLFWLMDQNHPVHFAMTAEEPESLASGARPRPGAASAPAR